MKAIQVAQTGGPNVLHLTQVKTPQPGPGEILVELKAVGVNFIDIYMRSGRYPSNLPFIPGFEGAGVVTEVGQDVTEVKVGDRVAYGANAQSYAEYNVINAWESIPLPDDFSFEQGAAFPLQGMTAHYLLHDYYKIKKGDIVLVHAAAGGVGLLLVQWLKHMGAKVIGTVSTDSKAEIASAAGADHIINYSHQNFVEECKKITSGKGVDFILDGVGKTTFPGDLEAVRVYGHICLYGSASGPADPFAPNSLQAKSVTISGGAIFNSLNTREELLWRANAVITGVREGWLNLDIGHVLPLESVAEAHQLLEERKTTGKIVLTVS